MRLSIRRLHLNTAVAVALFTVLTFAVRPDVHAQSVSPDPATLTHENLPEAGTTYQPVPLKRGRTVFPANEAGASARGLGRRIRTRSAHRGAAPSRSVMIDKRFEGFTFDDNPVENGFFFIPPDPIGAAGKSRLIAVVNSMIESRNKGGALQWREGLLDFFASLSPGFLPFDPKIVYDHYEDRFVVVALDYTDVFFGDVENGSKLLLAVSRSGNPASATAADWYFHAIDAKFTDDNFFLPGFFDYWADYPGFEVDEEAVYITANAFSFVTAVTGVGLVQVPGGTRLWIVDKGTGGGFYDGGPAQVDFYDPYDDFPGLRAAGLNIVTKMPAEVHGPAGAGPGVGTFLVSYSGLTFGAGGPEAVQVIRVDDPLGNAGGPQFVHEFVMVGDIEEPFAALPDAPQSGTNVRIEVNDRRALDAVWRDGRLLFTATIEPHVGPDAGETTAHWFEIGTSAVPGGNLTLSDQGNIGGEDIAPHTFTYFPAVAINRNGETAFGFSASAPSIFAGAFATVRRQGEPAGEVSSSQTVHEGEDFYLRAFGGSRNRWGDYSGISVDPTNDKFFWVFNQYAGERGIVFPVLPDEAGRWETAWARLKVVGGGPSSQIAAADRLLKLDGSAVPERFALEQNFPNPFNPSTEITFDLPHESDVRLTIYDVSGREVDRLVDGALAAGRHNVSWSPAALPSGVYFYRLTAGDFTEVRHMVMMK